MGSDCLGFFFVCHDAKYFVRFNLAKLLEDVNCTVVESYPALVAHVLIESFILKRKQQWKQCIFSYS